MEDNTPVLVGQGQFTYRGPPADAPSPLQLLLKATEAAALDAGLSPQALAALDSVGVVAFAIDAEGALAALPVPRLANPPASLAQRLGASPRWSAYTETGGNSSQHLINVICERIAAREADFAVGRRGVPGLADEKAARQPRLRQL